jgi:membrane fusion protein, multidrug efflux system
MDKQVSGRAEQPPASVRRSWRSGLIPGVVALLAIGGLGALYWRGGPSAPAGAGRPAAPPQASVSVGAVERGDIMVTVQALGTVTSTSTVTVRPQVSGQLQSVNFKEGQSVPSRP